MELLDRFVEGADATNLRSSFPASNSEKRTSNIWFQCPWRDFGDSNQTSDLLTSFVRSAAGIQDPGDILIVGLTNHPDYVRKYDLEGFKECARSYGYERLVSDSHFIGELLDLGYRHVGLDGVDIHWKILNHHVTHVFKKVRRAS